MDSESSIGPPRLLDFSCQICTKSSAADPGTTSATCWLQLKIEKSGGIVDNEPGVSTVLVDLPQPTLDTLLDGLGRIRDQLSSVASTK